MNNRTTNSKKITYNKVTGLIEVVTENHVDRIPNEKVTETEKRPKTFEEAAYVAIKGDKKRLSIWLAILFPSITIMIAIVGGVLAYRANKIQANMAIKQSEENKIQTDIANEQKDLANRQFDVSKMPFFVINVEVNDALDEETYRFEYRLWLKDNGIDNFFNWVLVNHNIEPDLQVNNSAFWDAFIDRNYQVLSEITYGMYDTYRNEYHDYLWSTDYQDYAMWKNRYRYETQNITVANRGANISNAKLNVYVYETFSVYINNRRQYKFGIDVCGDYITQYYIGKFDRDAKYDAKNNCFSIVYSVEPMSSFDALNRYNEIHEIWKSVDDELRKAHDSGVDVFGFINNAVYFSIEYLDMEHQEHCDWYIYDVREKTLTVFDARTPTRNEPNVFDYSMFDYQIAKCEYISEILGFSNCQSRSIWIYDEDRYIEGAKEKLLNDVQNLLSK